MPMSLPGSMWPPGSPGRRARAAATLAALLALTATTAGAQDADTGPSWDREALEATCEANAASEADRSTCLDIVRRVLAPAPGTGGDAAPFASITLRGRGDQVVSFDKPAGVPGLVDITHKGRGTFAVAALDGDGILNAWLVQDRGPYQGRSLLDSSPPPDQLCVAVCPDDDSTMFEVTAGGRWIITVEPLSEARTWSTAGPLSGDGDDVVRLDVPVSGSATTTVLAASGRDGLMAWPYTASDGVGRLGEESGAATLQAGTMITLPDGTALLQVKATGPWSLAPVTGD